ncbi:MAG: hypothetical protein U5O39_19030 [Gammaproteobacteria bacterium]|nr:hypothetical protein [Gammaproteobacteria bacterium]
MVDRATIDTTNAGGEPAGGDIALTSIDGAGVGTLTLDAGTAGVIATTGSVNNVLELEIANSGGASFDGAMGAVDPGIVTIVDTTDGATVEFNGSTQIKTLNTSAEAYNLSFFGTTNRIIDAVTFNNTGDLNFGNAASDSIEFTGGITVNSPVTLAGTMSTVDDDLTLQTLNIVDSQIATIETGGNALDITTSIQGTAGGGTEALVIDSGVGDVTLASIAGTADGLVDVTIANAANVSFDDISLTGSLLQSAAAIGGVTTFNGAVSVNSADLTGNAFRFVGGTTVTATNGFAVTGNLQTNSSVTTDLADITITGGLTLADNTDIVMTTEVATSLLQE